MLDELKERRNAELDFVRSAYSQEEAWCDRDDSGCESPAIHRRLHLGGVPVILTLNLPIEYPKKGSPLLVDGSVEESGRNGQNVKNAWNAVPALVESCRQVALENQGEESVFLVLVHADQWVQEEWPRYECTTTSRGPASHITEVVSPKESTRYTILGRRLIYSHHIISKHKRSTIKQLASSYKLTGYMRIGWPGLIIIEGLEDDCMAFYDQIRLMSWQYLVVRGEQHERLLTDDIISSRKFDSFQEVEDMSIVAQHCRSAGLEALFRTSLKVYDKLGPDVLHGNDHEVFGALIHVDHMNDGKKYRRWLRKTAQELDCLLFIRQCYGNDDFTKRTLILVGVIGENISAFLKRWRTSPVDVDSQGRACLERQMTVLINEPLNTNVQAEATCEVDWEKLQSEGSHLNVTVENLGDLLRRVGGTPWTEAFQQLLIR